MTLAADNVSTDLQVAVVERRGKAWRTHPLLPVGAALLPLVVLIAFAVKLTVDIPFWDQWQFVPLVEKSYQGTVSIYDLWAQHNEHRLLFPQLIMLILAHWTAWDVRYEMLVNIGLAILTLAALIYLAKQTTTDMGIAKLGWLLPLLSFMVFSLVHWDNWSWGWQIQIFLNVCAGVFALVLLSATKLALTWLRLAGAIACAVVASYSFANGLLLWPIGFALICAHHGSKANGNTNSRVTRALHVLAWLIAGVLTVGSYLYGYSNPRYEFSAFGYLIYVVTYLGTPVVNFNPEMAAIVGICGVLGQGYLLVALRQRYAITTQALLPYMALVAYVLGAALVTGVGRSALGSAQAASPRYVSIAYLFWVVTLIFLYGLSVRTPSHEGPFRLWIPPRNYIGACMAAILCLTLLSSVRGVVGIAHKYSDLTHVRAALIAGDPFAVPPSVLEVVYRDPNIVKAGLKILVKRHLSLYRNGKK